MNFSLILAFFSVMPVPVRYYFLLSSGIHRGRESASSTSLASRYIFSWARFWIILYYSLLCGALKTSPGARRERWWKPWRRMGTMGQWSRSQESKRSLLRKPSNPGQRLFFQGEMVSIGEDSSPKHILLHRRVSSFLDCRWVCFRSPFVNNTINKLSGKWNISDNLLFNTFALPISIVESGFIPSPFKNFQNLILKLPRHRITIN